MRRLCWLALLAMGCREKVDGSDTDTAGIDTEVNDADADGYATEDGDCNDSDASIYPGAVEICDGIDNNCDGEVDEGVTSTFYLDADADGFGDPDQTAIACDQPDGYVLVTNDCDDADETTYPGASERCDEADNDCDGEIDEDVQTEWYADADEDGFGDLDGGIDDCDPPEGYVENSDDCNDLSAEANPDAAEVCDEIDNDCDTLVDEDVTTTYYQDADGDNYGVSDVTTEACARPGGYAAQAGDCDDASDAVNPSATELCNGVDDDCDSATDEDDAADASTWYADDDGDRYGDAADTAAACDQPSGYVSADSDCDDSTADANPGATELCDRIDNDCDGETDEDSAADASTWYADNDGDGYGGSSTTAACSQPSGFADNSDDCNDSEADANPGESEVCDDIDNDCDGDTDEGLTSTFYLDADGDGYGTDRFTTDACDAPTGYVSDSTDCDDGESSANPGESEVCDEIDNDCDGDTDEGVTSTYYLDYDGDGYGDDGRTTEACSAPSGYTTDNTDCDDTTADANPSETESCDEIDNDCDGDTDEGLTSTFYDDDDGDGYGDEDDPVEACTAPSGTVSTGGDCDDRDSAVSPDADEVCDGVDNDCDELVDDDDDSLDESTGDVWFPDNDGDGYGAEPASCVELLDAGFTDDGVYTIFPFGDGTSIEVYCDMTDDDGGWMRIFHHDAQGGTVFFSSDSDASLKNEDDPEALLYSILDHMAYFEDASGGFTFRIDWPGSSSFTGANIWSQSSDPTTSSVSGYSAIDVDYTAQYWGGLEPSGSYTFIDGSVGHGNWYYSIGSQTSWSGSIPGPSAVVDAVSLWVRTDESAYSAQVLACDQPSGYTDLAGDCDDNDNDTYTGAAESCDGEDNDCDGGTDEGVIGESSSCPAESCAEIVELGADDGDGEYSLDPDGDGTAEDYACDMTTDGGGWTRIVDWDRVSDGDSVSDFEAAFTEEANNMSLWRTSSGTSYLEWADNNATADVLSYRADVDVPNSGELLYDLYFYGYSMEQSAVWFFADVEGTFTDLLCKEDVYVGYTSSELAYEPYTCASSAATTWTWNYTGEQTDFGGQIDALYMRSMMYDTYGDYARLYRLGLWVR